MRKFTTDEHRWGSSSYGRPNPAGNMVRPAAYPGGQEGKMGDMAVFVSKEKAKKGELAGVILYERKTSARRIE
jgi:hypothetical protein